MLPFYKMDVIYKNNVLFNSDLLLILFIFDVIYEDFIIMEIEETRNLIKRADLVSFSFKGELLNETLIDIVNLINEQQKVLDKIRSEIENKQNKYDHESYMLKVSAEIDKINEYILDSEKVTHDKQTYVNEIQKILEDKIQDLQTQILITVNSTVANSISPLNDNIFYMNRQITQIEEKLNEKKSICVDDSNVSKKCVNEEKIKDLEAKFAEIEEKIMSSPHIVKMKNELNDRIESLKKQIDAINLGADSQVKKIPTRRSLLIDDTSRRPSSSLAISRRSLLDVDRQPSSLPSNSFYAQTTPVIDSIQESEQEHEDNKRLDEAIDLVKENIREESKVLTNKIDKKADIVLVERMFERMRSMVAAIKDDYEQISKRANEFVTHSEMESWLAKAIYDALEKERKSPFIKDLVRISSISAKQPVQESPKKIFKSSRSNSGSDSQDRSQP